MLHAVSKKWLLTIIFMVLVLATMPVLTACGGDDDDGDDDGASGGVKEFRLGELTSHSGTLEEMDQSAFMAVDEINDAGGIQVGDTTYKVKFYWADDRTTATGAVTAIQQLLYNDKVHAVDVGGNMAGGAVIQPYVEDERIPTCYWDTGDVILGPDKPYSFRIHFDTRLNNMIILDWVRQNRPDLKKIEIIHLDLWQFTNSIPVEKKVWEEWGMDVHYTPYDFAVKDFYPVLTAALRNNPDALVVTQSAGNSLITQANEMGFKGTYILSEMLPPWWGRVLSNEDLEGLISLTPVLNSPAVPQAYKNYLVSYEDRVGALPYASKVFSEYTWVYLMAAALKKAGSTDGDKLKEAMESGPLTLEFPEGATMTIEFSGKEFFGIDHNWQPNQYIAVIENGEQVQKATLTAADQMKKYTSLFAKYEGTAGEYMPEETEPIVDDRPQQKLSIDSTVGALVDNPDTFAILQKYMAKNMEDPRFPMTYSLSLRVLFEVSPPGSYPEGTLEAIEAELNALYGDE